LIVDDELVTRAKLAKILETSCYYCRTVECSKKAREALNDENYHLVISDINMPGESGDKFIAFVLDNYPDTAAIAISGNDDSDFALSMLNLGVYDYIIKPLSRNNVLISVANALKRQKLETSNRILRLNLERKVEERTQFLNRSMQRLEKAMSGIVYAMANTVEIRDPYTANHQRRVANLAYAIASEIGLGREQREAVKVAAIIHDLGKISIPAEILSKPSRLTENEFNLIKEHPQRAYEIITEIEFPWDIANIIKQHHEKLDGSGYPLGLRGDNILPESRVITVADVVEAMASHRPYRPALAQVRQ
jgi:putative nucleotidyltransferase with HDIG domain